jgi:hypothetical protein
MDILQAIVTLHGLVLSSVHFLFAMGFNHSWFAMGFLEPKNVFAKDIPTPRGLTL